MPERPWYKFYSPDLPQSLEYPNSSIPLLLRNSAKKFPENIAIDMKAEGQLIINFDYSRVEFNRPQTIPFTIPQKYERTD